MRCRVAKAIASSRRAEIAKGFGAAGYGVGGDTRDEPTIFVGVYREEDLDAVEQHRGPATVMFCGGDARHGGWTATRLNVLPRPRIQTVAARSLAPILDAHGVVLDRVADIYVGDHAAFQPCPAGDAVFVGMPYSRRIEYGIPLVERVAALVPDIPFMLSRWGNAPAPFANAILRPTWQPTAAVAADLAACFCQIRCHPRDGFSTGVCEAALMGRPTCHVLDTGLPWIAQRTTAEEIAEFIIEARARAPDFDLAAAARAHVEDHDFLPWRTP